MAFVNPSAMLTQAYRGVGFFKQPLPLRIVAIYPSWDRFVFTVHPRCGIRSLADMKAKRYPLRVSVREDPTHSTLVLIEQAFALHGFTLKDVESWGGKLVLCGGPCDVRRLEPCARARSTWSSTKASRRGCRVAGGGHGAASLDEAEFDAPGQLGWRSDAAEVALPGLGRRKSTRIDFSGWPIYCSASLTDRPSTTSAARSPRAMPRFRGSGDYNGIAQHMVRDTDETPIDVPLHPGAERWFREHAQAGEARA